MPKPTMHEASAAAAGAAAAAAAAAAGAARAAAAAAAQEQLHGLHSTSCSRGHSNQSGSQEPHRRPRGNRTPQALARRRVNRQGRIEKARASSAASESALGPGEHDTTHSAQNRSYRELEQENKKLAHLLKLTRQQKQRDVKTAAARGATAKTAKQSKRARAKNLREKEDAARKKGKERERASARAGRHPSHSTRATASTRCFAAESASP